MTDQDEKVMQDVAGSDREKTSGEIQLLIDDMVARSKELQNSIQQTENDLVAMRKEYQDIVGYSYTKNGGLLGNLRSQLAFAVRNEQDADAVPIHWIRNSYDCQRHGQFVLVKVTAKRIAIRQRGTVHQDMYELNGKSVGFKYNNPIIDIRKTFGIDADTVPPNWKSKT